MSGLIIALIVIGVIVVIAFVLIGIYNGLVRRACVSRRPGRASTSSQAASSLVPNLVETVKGYASHERETLEAVTRARSTADNAGTARRPRRRTTC